MSTTQPNLRHSVYGQVGAPEARASELVQTWHLGDTELIVRTTVRYDKRGDHRCVSDAELLVMAEDMTVVSTFRLAWEYPSNWFQQAQMAEKTSASALVSLLEALSLMLVGSAAEILAEGE